MNTDPRRSSIQQRTNSRRIIIPVSGPTSSRKTEKGWWGGGSVVIGEWGGGDLCSSVFIRGFGFYLHLTDFVRHDEPVAEGDDAIRPGGDVGFVGDQHDGEAALAV
jgi:hypothetical protein